MLIRWAEMYANTEILSPIALAPGRQLGAAKISTLSYPTLVTAWVF